MSSKQNTRRKELLLKGDRKMIAEKIGVSLVYVSYVIHHPNKYHTPSAKLILKAFAICQKYRKETETKIDEMIRREQFNRFNSETEEEL